MDEARAFSAKHKKKSRDLHRFSTLLKNTKQHDVVALGMTIVPRESADNARKLNVVPTILLHSLVEPFIKFHRRVSASDET